MFAKKEGYDVSKDIHKYAPRAMILIILDHNNLYEKADLKKWQTKMVD
jgi:hypothetical protein